MNDGVRTQPQAPPPSSLLSRLEFDLFPYVNKPARYIGNELNIIRKDLSTVSVHGVLCFPDLYDIGMSHHGLQILYHCINRCPTWALSRCFHPWSDAEKILREKLLPLYSLEYFTPVKDAQWVGFSMQYELQYTNVLNMLDLAGIPPRSRDRAGTSAPIIIAGGPCMCNPEPMAEFLDAVVVGDGEEALAQVCATLEAAGSRGAPRDAALRDLSGLRGVYVPSLSPARKSGIFLVPERGDGRQVRAARIAELSSVNYPPAPLVPLVDVVHHRLAVEVMRGCTRGCRFCAAGSFYRPVRERAPCDVLDQIEVSTQATGWQDVGLLSLSTADYSQLTPLLRDIRSLGASQSLSISIPSTRTDALDKEQLDLLDAVSHSSSMTIAPEAGSERLRRVINKGFTDRQVLDSVELLLTRNTQTVKLYFMIGLPTETDQDIDALVGLVEQISVLVRRASKRRSVHVAVSPFSPKPGTPFQWEAMAPVETLSERARFIKRSLGSRANVKVDYRDSRVTMLETVLARGDRTMGEVVHQAWKLGARMDGWEEYLSVDRWEQAARDAGVDLALFTGAIPLDQPLPWSVIDSGVSLGFLRAEREKAYAEQETTDCRTAQCSACGACSLGSRRLADTGPAPEPVRGTRPASQRNPSWGRGRPAGSSGGPASQHWYRMTYRKLGLSRFLGHRDMVNILQRAFTMAGLPLEYSCGFHPHPRVVFGPPLPLGVGGASEQLDLATVSPHAIDLGGLNTLLPTGLEIAAVCHLPGKPDSLSAATAAARYVFTPSSQVRAEEVGTAIEQFLALPHAVVSYEKKGKMVSRDVRPLVFELVRTDPRTGRFEALLCAEPDRTCSPAELVMAAFGGHGISDFAVVRTECLGRAGAALVALV